MIKTILFVLLTFSSIIKLQAQTGCYTPTITGESSACIGSIIEYRILPTPINFNWTVSTGGSILSLGPGGAFPSTYIATVQWNASGLQSVTASCGSQSTTFNVNVSSTTVPTTPVTLTGNSNVCLNSNASYAVPSVAGLSYIWEIQQNGSVANNQTSSAVNNTFNVTWTTGGTYQVNAYYSNGACKSPAKSLAVIVQQTPVLQIPTGIHHCVGETTTFYALYGGGSDTYIWSINGGEQIVNMGNSATVTWDNEGTYTVSAFASNTCFGSGPISSSTVTINPQMQLGSISGPSSPCLNTNLTFSVNPVPSATYYAWNVVSMPLGANYPSFANAATSHPTIKFTTAGTYTISAYATNSNCYSNTQTLTIMVVNGSAAQGFLSGPSNLCFGSNATLTAFADPFNGIPSNTVFNWWSFDDVNITNITNVPATLPPLPPGNSQSTYNSEATINSTTPGYKNIMVNYTVPGGCTSPTSSKSLFIDKPTIPTIIGNTTPNCDTEYTYYTTGGTSDFQWVFSQGATVISGGTSSDYSTSIRWDDGSSQTISVHYKDQYGCIPSAPGTLSLTPIKKSQSITFPDLSNVTFGQVPPTLFPITNLGLNVSYTSSNTLVATVLGNILTLVGAGSSVITANQTGNGCALPLANSNTTLTVNKASQTISFGSVSAYMCLGEAISLNATTSSGLPITSYSSSNSNIVTVTGNTISAVGVGNVIITAYQEGNSNFYSKYQTIAIAVAALPNAIVTPSGPTMFCMGSTVTLTSSTGSAYLWSTGATTQAITVSNTGNYSVTVNDSYYYRCASLSQQTIVTANPLPVAAITPGGATTFCSGGSVTLTSSPGTSYLWSNGATIQSITVSSSGNYSVTVNNVNGCSATSVATPVTVNSLPSATITSSGTTTFCSGGSVTLTSSSSSSYLWSTGATTQSITVSTSGNYSATITNSNGCSSTSPITNVTVNSNPAISISVSSTACGSASLTANGGTSYSWSGQGVSGGGNSKIAYSSGWYYVTGYNSAGCSGSASMYVTINPIPSISISGATSACSYSTLTGVGGSSYSWSGPGVSGSGSTKTAYYTGWYYVTGYNSYNCSSSSSIYVTINPNPTVSIYKSSGNICNGYINATASATAGSSYYWPAASPYPASSSSTVPVKAGQTRSVTVTLNGCSASASYYAGYCSGGGGGNPRIATYTPEVVPEIFVEAALPGIFPNPVDNELNVVLENPVEISAEIQLSELSGKILTSRSLSAGEYKTTIITESIPDGIYLLAILSDSRKKYVKVLVNHSK